MLPWKILTSDQVGPFLAIKRVFQIDFNLFLNLDDNQTIIRNELAAQIDVTHRHNIKLNDPVEFPPI